MGSRAQRKLLSGRRLVSCNHSSPPYLLSSLFSSLTFPLLSSSFCHFISSFFPFDASSLFFSALYAIHHLRPPLHVTPLLFSLTLTPHPWPPPLYLSFIFSSPLFYLACISSPLLLFVILLLFSHLSSSSLPSSPLLAIHHLCSPLPGILLLCLPVKPPSSTCHSVSPLTPSFLSSHPLSTSDCTSDSASSSSTQFITSAFLTSLT